jgi:hypothetical protein
LNPGGFFSWPVQVFSCSAVNPLKSTTEAKSIEPALFLCAEFGAEDFAISL